MRWGSTAPGLCLALACGCGDAPREPTHQPPEQNTLSSSSSGGGVTPMAGVPLWRCAPGEVELGGGVCQPAGVDSCSAGFDSDGAGGCVAIMPAAECGAGLIAIPGDSACRPVMPCPSGTAPWEGIPVDSTTHYVDASFAGTSDGTSAAPWTTLTQANNNAPPGALIAIAPGEYGNVVLSKPLRLWGRCPGEVVIENSNDLQQAVHIGSVASGSEIHNLAIDSTKFGIEVVGAIGVIIDQVAVLNGGDAGLYVRSQSTATPGEATFSRSLIENTQQGIIVQGSTATVEESAIRDSVSPDMYGQAILVIDEPAHALEGALMLRRSYLTRADGSAIGFAATRLHVEDSLLRDVDAHAEAVGQTGGIVILRGAMGSPVDVRLSGSVVEQIEDFGMITLDDVLIERTTLRDVTPGFGDALGVFMDRPDGMTTLSTITMRWSKIERVTGPAMLLETADAIVEGVLVRDLMPSSQGGAEGIIVASEVDESLLLEGSATLRGVVVERAIGSGIASAGASVVVESSRVSDTEVNDMLGKLGRGLAVESLDGVRGSARVDGCLFENSHEGGIVVLSSDLDVTSSVVRGVLPRPVDGRYGRGIVLQGLVLPSSAQIALSHIVDATEGGISVSGATALISTTLVEQTQHNGDGLFGDAIMGIDLSQLNHPTMVTLEDSILRSSARAGLSTHRVPIELRHNHFMCNAIDLVSERIDDGQLVDLGDNACGCDGELMACKLTSSGVAPPQPLQDP